MKKFVQNLLAKIGLGFLKNSNDLAMQSVREIQNEKQNFRNLFSQTPEIVCILKGPEHTFEFVNAAHIQTLGFEATGMKVREAQPESVEVHKVVDEVYRTGKTAKLHHLSKPINPTELMTTVARYAHELST